MNRKFTLVKSLLFSATMLLTTSAFSQINVKTESGDLNVRFMGRTNFDAGALVSTSNENFNLHNALAMNDTRLGVLAKFGEENKFSAKIEVSFNQGNQIAFKDLWIGYALNSNSTITIGNQFQAFGAQPLGLAFKFVEDASADKTFCPLRKIGALYAYTSDKFNGSVGLFSDASADKKAADQGFSVTGKAIYRPIINDQQILHIGAAPMYTQSPNPASFSCQPSTIGTSLIEKKNIDAESVTRLEGELIYINRRFYFEAHYLMATTNDVKEINGIDTTTTNFTFNGEYAQASFLIIGEQQNYNKKTGLAANASPKNLEALVRVSRTDLSDANCGEEYDYTVGLNYFFNKNLNVKLNYIWGKVKDGDDISIVQTRLQFSF